MTTLCTLLLVLLLTPGPVRADDTRQYQRAIIQEVFDRLTAAAGEAMRLRPRLVIDTMGEAASYDAWQHILHVDVHLYDLCKDMGADSINALATVIGHELAHYYLDHGGYDAHDRADARKALHASLQWKVTRETEADFYGGIYRHLAGYDSYITGSVLEMLYERYHYSDVNPEYLSRDKRKDIAITVDDSLRRLIPVFDMANNLTLVRFYGLSQQCYDYLIRRFPSRETLNNAGAAYALQAVGLVGGDFTYPFELDEDTRLTDVKLDRGVRASRVRSPSPSDSALAIRLLDSAGRRFISAVDKDPAYGPALLNLASVRLLQGDFTSAIDLAGKARERDTARHTRLLAFIVEAIAEARKGEKDAARRRLNDIIGLSDSESARRLAGANLAAVDSTSFPLPSGENTLGSEMIESHKAGDTSITPYRMYTTQEVVGGDSSIRVRTRNLHFSNAVRALTRTQWVQFLCTGSEYPESSKKGITRGTTLGEVVKLYGALPRIINAVQGRYYIYESSKIIFLIDDDDRVVRWVIYDMGTLQPEEPNSGAPEGSHSRKKRSLPLRTH